MDDPGSTAWSWNDVGKCWVAVDSSHACINDPVVALANMAVDGLCPTAVEDVFSPVGYLSAMANIKQFSAAAGSPINPSEIELPTAVAGGEWLRYPESFDTDGLVDTAVVEAINGVIHFTWNVEDSAASTTVARPSGGKAVYYRPITNKERATALSCGWSLTASLRIASCASRSSVIKVNFDGSTRVWDFFLCVNGDGNVQVWTIFQDFIVSSGGTGTADYHTYIFTYNPAVVDGVILSFDGVDVNAGTPIASQGSGTGGVSNSVQWGTGSSAGRSSANFELVAWQLLDLTCLSSFSTYEGCMDDRYTNYDPTAAIQNNAASCVDSDTPVVDVGALSVDIEQFSPYQIPTAVATDTVDGDVSVAVVVTGSVDTAIVAVYSVVFTVSDAVGNGQTITLSVNVVEFDECESAPCQNQTTCAQSAVQADTPLADQRFVCSCTTGWSGETCAADSDECAATPCNTGVCTDSNDDVAIAIGVFLCACNAGYAGTTCQTDVDDCAVSPCQNSATCADQVNGHACTCTSGWTGTNCADDADDCLATPCANGATCADAGTYAFSCTCASGWEGTTCTSSIDPCAFGTDNCHSNAACTHTAPGTFTCACSTGYVGDGLTTCVDIDECASGPCLNGGACLESTVQSTATCVETVSGGDASDTAACNTVTGSHWQCSG